MQPGLEGGPGQELPKREGEAEPLWKDRDTPSGQVESSSLLLTFSGLHKWVSAKVHGQQCSPSVFASKPLHLSPG